MRVDQPGSEAATMSERQPWRCRACGRVLGEVVDGILAPHVAVRSVDRRGVAEVLCPSCGRVKLWFPTTGPALGPAGTRRAR
jgi:hypothetical protein